MVCAWSVLAVVMSASPSVEAKAALERADRLVASGDLVGAASSYTEALSKSPRYAEALNGLGNVFLKQGKTEEAIAQFKAAIEANPQFKPAHFNLGYAERSRGNFTAAAAAYERYTQLAPDDPDGFYGLAESYRLGGDFRDASAAYEVFIDKEHRPSAQKGIEAARQYLLEIRSGGAGEKKGTPQRKAAAKEAPIQVSSGSAEERISEGEQLINEHRYQEATFLLQDAVNADPSNAEALIQLGNAYAAQRYFALALQKWERAAQWATDFRQRAKAQARIDELEIRGTAQAKTSDDTDASGNKISAGAREAYLRGIKAVDERKYASAIDSLDRAILAVPAFAPAYVARGSANIGLSHFLQAAADYERALKLDPKLSSSLYGLAEAYRGLGRTAEARQFYRQYAVSRAPDARPELQREAQQKAENLR